MMIGIAAIAIAISSTPACRSDTDAATRDHEDAQIVECARAIASRAGDEPNTTVVYFTLASGELPSPGETIRCVGRQRANACRVLAIVDGGTVEALCPR